MELNEKILDFLDSYPLEAEGCEKTYIHSTGLQFLYEHSEGCLSNGESRYDTATFLKEKEAGIWKPLTLKDVFLSDNLRRSVSLRPYNEGFLFRVSETRKVTWAILPSSFETFDALGYLKLTSGGYLDTYKSEDGYYKVLLHSFTGNPGKTLLLHRSGLVTLENTETFLKEFKPFKCEDFIATLPWISEPVEGEGYKFLPSSEQVSVPWEDFTPLMWYLAKDNPSSITVTKEQLEKNFRGIVWGERNTDPNSKTLGRIYNPLNPRGNLTEVIQGDMSHPTYPFLPDKIFTVAKDPNDIPDPDEEVSLEVLSKLRLLEARDVFERLIKAEDLSDIFPGWTEEDWEKTKVEVFDAYPNRVVLKVVFEEEKITLDLNTDEDITAYAHWILSKKEVNYAPLLANHQGMPVVYLGKVGSFHLLLDVGSNKAYFSTSFYSKEIETIDTLKVPLLDGFREVGVKPIPKKVSEVSEGLRHRYGAELVVGDAMPIRVFGDIRKEGWPPFSFTYNPKSGFTLTNRETMGVVGNMHSETELYAVVTEEAKNRSDKKAVVPTAEVKMVENRPPFSLSEIPINELLFRVCRDKIEVLKVTQTQERDFLSHVKWETEPDIGENHLGKVGKFYRPDDPTKLVEVRRVSFDSPTTYRELNPGFNLKSTRGRELFAYHPSITQDWKVLMEESDLLNAGDILDEACEGRLEKIFPQASLDFVVSVEDELVLELDFIQGGEKKHHRYPLKGHYNAAVRYYATTNGTLYCPVYETHNGERAIVVDWFDDRALVATCRSSEDGASFVHVGKSLRDVVLGQAYATEEPFSFRIRGTDNLGFVVPIQPAVFKLKRVIERLGGYEILSCSPNLHGGLCQLELKTKEGKHVSVDYRDGIGFLISGDPKPLTTWNQAYEKLYQPKPEYKTNLPPSLAQLVKAFPGGVFTAENGDGKRVTSFQYDHATAFWVEGETEVRIEFDNGSDMRAWVYPIEQKTGILRAFVRAVTLGEGTESPQVQMLEDKPTFYCDLHSLGVVTNHSVSDTPPPFLKVFSLTLDGVLTVEWEKGSEDIYFVGNDKPMSRTKALEAARAILAKPASEGVGQDSGPSTTETPVAAAITDPQRLARIADVKKKVMSSIAKKLAAKKAAEEIRNDKTCTYLGKALINKASESGFEAKAVEFIHGWKIGVTAKDSEFAPEDIVKVSFSIEDQTCTFVSRYLGVNTKITTKNAEEFFQRLLDVLKLAPLPAKSSDVVAHRRNLISSILKREGIYHDETQNIDGSYLWVTPCGHITESVDTEGAVEYQLGPNFVNPVLVGSSTFAFGQLLNSIGDTAQSFQQKQRIKELMLHGEMKALLEANLDKVSIVRDTLGDSDDHYGWSFMLTAKIPKEKFGSDNPVEARRYIVVQWDRNLGSIRVDSESAGYSIQTKNSTQGAMNRISDLCAFYVDHTDELNCAKTANEFREDVIKTYLGDRSLTAAYPTNDTVVIGNEDYEITEVTVRRPSTYLYTIKNKKVANGNTSTTDLGLPQLPFVLGERMVDDSNKATKAMVEKGKEALQKAKEAESIRVRVVNDSFGSLIIHRVAKAAPHGQTVAYNTGVNEVNGNLVLLYGYNSIEWNPVHGEGRITVINSDVGGSYPNTAEGRLEALEMFVKQVAKQWSSPTVPRKRDPLAEAFTRTAVKQTVRFAREPFLALLEKHLGSSGPSANLKRWVHSPVGDVFLRGLLALGMTGLQKKYYPDNSNLESVIKELRVSTLTLVGDGVADVILTPLREILCEALRNSEGLEEKESSVVGALNPHLEIMDAPVIETSGEVC